MAMTTTAKFSNPSGLVFGSDGSLFVTDVFNFASVRKITPDGTVSTLAGGNGQGLLNGNAATAQFEFPFDLVFGSDGSLYVADWGNEAIRKISPNGTVSTLAGGNGEGLENGAGNVAKFNDPTGITIDPFDNLYVADRAFSLIRKITPDGSVSTYAGGNGSGRVDGSVTVAKFDSPNNIVYASDGSLFVSDVNSIRKISPNRIVSTIAGGVSPGDVDGVGAAARFNYPWGMGIDAEGNLYVADSNNHRIKRISPGGNVTTLVGGEAGYVNGGETEALFNYPKGIIITSGALFVVDAWNQAIRKIAIAGLEAQGPWNSTEGTTTSFTSEVASTTALQTEVASTTTLQTEVASTTTATENSVASEETASTSSTPPPKQTEKDYTSNGTKQSNANVTIFFITALITAHCAFSQLLE